MKRKREQPVPVMNAAVAYCRVSTEEQVRGGVSLDAQAERLEAYCRSAGLHLVSGSELIRSLQRGSKKSMLARAIGELGRIPKTLHLLAYIDDVALHHIVRQRRILRSGRHV